MYRGKYTAIKGLYDYRSNYASTQIREAILAACDHIKINRVPFFPGFSVPEATNHPAFLSCIAGFEWHKNPCRSMCKTKYLT